MTALTTAERQSRRQAALNQKAQELGYPTWRKLETDYLKGKLEITKMDAFDFEKFIAKESSTAEYLGSFEDAETAALELWSYITGDAATDTAAYDPEAAAEMRKVKLADVLDWVNREWDKLEE
jgi:hypothetical protein